ncbi:glucosaminidase domain-containing protein [Paenibacillus alkaliterrae]|uniref:glucosaminidase domain-containing protein n=1 Tax=Paenibacillus alkaliterrae TaxID=320909 RepID=UPI001F2CCB3A|nr:glucosaminidase domain-containing protein [Paenibacillus alkaliterrae]MCF2938214.1 glucosaminidase domain-containing protein [Paenibacillus alkaliterrae]
MRKKLIQQSFIYFLMLSVIVTLGMYVQPINKNKAESVIAAAVVPAEAAPIASPKEIIFSQTMPPYPPEPTIENKQSDVSILSVDPPAKKESPVIEEPLPAYRVTAYYLNVRTEPNARSRIMTVVELGTTFEIVTVLDNGWLELKDGGFIHGGYAKLIEREAQDREMADQKKEKGAVSIESNTYEASQQTEEEEMASEPGKPTSIVESDSGLTVAHIEKIFAGTALSGHGLEEAILEIEDEYGINAFFTIAVMKLESGNGKSKIAKLKNNLFGLNAIDGDQYNKAFSFKTKGDSVRRFGKLLAKHYVGKGLETIEQVAKKYCPANSKWSGLVKNIMKSDYRKL